jgi:hypothetical protein
MDSSGRMTAAKHIGQAGFGIGAEPRHQEHRSPSTRPADGGQRVRNPQPRAALGGTGAGVVWLLSRAFICNRGDRLVHRRSNGGNRCPLHGMASARTTWRRSSAASVSGRRPALPTVPLVVSRPGVMATGIEGIEAIQ